MEVAVIGGGYVGLVQTAGLAHLGHRVRLADVDPARIGRLEAGELPIFEPGLSELFERARQRKLISFFDDNRQAVKGAEVVFLTLPTPSNGDGSADTSVIFSVVEEIAPVLEPNTVVVTKSTVPVGTGRALEELLAGINPRVHVASNPEFLSEGNAVDDFLRAERIVVGASDRAVAERVASLYEGLPARPVLTDPTSAELIKYGANAYLATRITFFNSLAELADRFGADIADVTAGIGLDRRIGPHFMRPGPGWGGSCFPKDTRALAHMARQVGYRFGLVEEAIESNRRHQELIVERCRELVGGSLDGLTVGLWGVAFKAGTDDTRESPALVIAQGLIAQGARVRAADPEAISDLVEMTPDPVAAAEGAAMVVVATEWPEFLRVDMGEVARVMAGDVVFDLRNLLDPEAVRKAGLRYVGRGRPSA
jgi:UDPglucose 6-dehydrogenase